ncbi:MAG: UDP-N-acetylmuramoyl-L-alanyl-D-glutamate--2,6-diaminopimelate ligase [Piscirickettsiaceae bacterium]|nr:MAG: UDP-N-acetylmuramoyl-L-alanyl-D-glutamate--2,6-diaminopimelate ligase [Piscirickettsiaceae bacterium]PCI70820.1 MAG: UDP-N-acetylmuramoyl-L-alanyl-D-glutamate--2,6-diaminopimelate ligase [Piscirickettsiaceae bacterium]
MMAAKRYEAEMTSLRELLAGVVNVDVDVCISMMTLDARSVESDGLFCAVNGSRAHGLQYADQAIRHGVSAIIYDPAGGGLLLAEKYNKRSDVVMVAIVNLASQLSELAARFYQRPANKLSVIGITGTNGKTSVSHYIAEAMQERQRCAMIGTLGWGFLGELIKTDNTTPDAISVQAQLASAGHAGAKVVAMEVSSHGLQQARVATVAFNGAVFTNLTHDHLDYHGSMEAYGAAKLALFENQSLTYAVINLDDEFSAKILSVLSPSVRVYGYSRVPHLNADVDVLMCVENELNDIDGLSFQLNLLGRLASVKASLFGDFNVDNVVATMAVLLAEGWSLTDAADAVQSISNVPGRMECVVIDDALPMVIVDFAHTPDALASVLKTVRQHCGGSLSVVFGCGGNRDRSKRALMGNVAADYADSIIITTDNPRDESAEEIAQHILGGVKDQSSTSIVLDRAEAISQAINDASIGDIVVVAGKGHEDYQLIGGKTLRFSDVEVVRAALERRLQQEAR